jgi:hypothetical protein
VLASLTAQTTHRRKDQGEHGGDGCNPKSPIGRVHSSDEQRPGRKGPAIAVASLCRSSASAELGRTERKGHRDPDDQGRDDDGTNDAHRSPSRVLLHEGWSEMQTTT